MHVRRAGAALFSTLLLCQSALAQAPQPVTATDGGVVDVTTAPPPAPSAPAPSTPAPSATPVQPAPGGYLRPYSPYPPPGYVPLVLEGSQPGLSFTLSLDRKAERPVVRCPDRCLVYVTPNEYWLSVGESSDTLAGRRKVSVDGPSRLVVDPRTKSARSTGLTLGVSGIVLLFVGSIALLAGIGESLDENSESGSNLAVLGLGGMVAGAILTPIGWVQFGRSAPGVQNEQLMRAR